MKNPVLRVAAPDVLEGRDLPSTALSQLPVLPEMDPATVGHMRMVAQVGQLNGLRSNVFVKVGDSNTSTSNYMYPLATAAANISSLSPDDQATVNNYRTPIDASGINSFNRASTATYPGWTVRYIDSTVEGEVDATKAAVATIMIGTNDIAFVPMPEYITLLGAVVDRLVAKGVIPVLTTIPHLLYQGQLSDAAAASYNQAIADIAEQKHVPLLNLWSGLSGLPDSGLGADKVHLNVSPNGAGSLSAVDLAFGQNYRESVTIQALTQIRKQVFEYNPQQEAS